MKISNTLATATIMTFFVVSAIQPATAQIKNSKVALSADIASAYVFRGATFNDGPVFQPGMEISGLPITVGVWGNMDLSDNNNTLKSGEFSEMDLYASYVLPLNTDKIETSLGYTEYTYMSSGSQADREASLNLSLAAPLSPSLTVYYGLDGAIEQDVYVEAAVGQDLPLPANISASMSASVAYYDDNETTNSDGNQVQGEIGISNFTLGASVSYKLLTASIAYVESLDDKVLADIEDGGAYDVKVYGSLGISYEF